MKLLIATILLFLCHLAIAQTVEEEFLSNPKFDSQIEKITGLMLQKKDVTLPEIEEISKSIDKFIVQFENSKFKKKSIEKQVKLIFEKTHDKFFKKYEYLASFDEIFNDGIYNCVSGSALFVLILEKLQIKYHIISEPNHVFVIVNPRSEAIVIESTDPVTGAGFVDEKFKRDYIKEMVAQKLLLREEFPGATDVEIYNSLFDDQQEIVNIKDLFAYQYSNTAAENIMSENLELAIKNLEKSISLNKTKEALNSLNFCYAMIYEKNIDNYRICSDLLVKMVNSVDSLSKKQEEFIEGEGCRLINNYMIKVDYLDSANLVFERLINLSKLSSLKDKFYECYHANKLYYLSLKEEFVSFIPSVFVMNKYNPRDIRYTTGTKDLIGCLKYIEEDNADTIYSMLGVDNPIYYPEEIFLSFKNAKEIIENIAKLNDDNLEGINFLFDYDLSEIDLMTEMNKTLLSFLFEQAWGFYLREQENQKAIDIAKKGMELFPESKSLKEKYKMANDTYGKK